LRYRYLHVIYIYLKYQVGNDTQYSSSQTSGIAGPQDLLNLRFPEESALIDNLTSTRPSSPRPSCDDRGSGTQCGLAGRRAIGKLEPFVSVSGLTGNFKQSHNVSITGVTDYLFLFGSFVCVGGRGKKSIGNLQETPCLSCLTYHSYPSCMICPTPHCWSGQPGYLRYVRYYWTTPPLNEGKH